MRGPTPKPPWERFMAKTEWIGGCLIWTGTSKGSGYGQFRLSDPRRMVLAHRYAYEQMVGPIPEGLQLDHLCRNRPCVFWEHLEPVTQRENLLRGENIVAINATKTHCLEGHELTPENLYKASKGHRRCRTCHLRRVRERRERLALGQP